MCVWVYMYINPISVPPHSSQVDILPGPITPQKVPTDCISPNERPRYDTKQYDKASVILNVEYPFIAITPRSTLAQISSTS